MRAPILALSLTGSVTMAWHGVQAAGLAPLAPLICATNEAFDCSPNSQSVSDSPAAVDLPRFNRQDFSSKRGITRGMGGQERTIEIGFQETEEGQLILLGLHHGRCWSMSPTKETGFMSPAISRDLSGFVAFGTCATP
jgi:hypothetical protein